MTPTLKALQHFDANHRHDAATLSDIGMMLLNPPEGRWCEDTPKNGITFAHTGGDSVHFCLLEVDGKLIEESPVVMVLPCFSDNPRLVVGDSLRDFLALGCVIGYFFLEQLAYDFDTTLSYLFDFDAFVKHSYMKLSQNDIEDLAAQRALLAALSKDFSLEPWPDPASRIDALRKKWSPKIELT